jgi:Flp pilus assembly protein TadG
VALEFALTAPLLLVLMGAGVDLGVLLRVQIVMASGLMNAVQYANVQGVATTNAHLLSVMQNATALTGMTASVAGPSCYCPSTYPVRLTAATCGSTCATGGTPGSYVVITASYPYVPMMPGLSHVVATNVVQSATAMLQ